MMHHFQRMFWINRVASKIIGSQLCVGDIIFGHLHMWHFVQLRTFYPFWVFMHHKDTKEEYVGIGHSHSKSDEFSSHSQKFYIGV